MWNKIGKILRFIICLGLIYYIIQRIDFQPLKVVVTNIKWGYCFLILVILWLQDIIKAFKWYHLLKAKNVNIPIIQIIQVDYVSTFLSLFVPSTISLDLFRAYGLSKEVTTKNQAASSILVDRALSLFALLTVANLSVIFFYEKINVPEIAISSITVLTFFILGVFLIRNTKIIKSIDRRTSLSQKFKIIRKLGDLRHSINEYENHKIALIKVYLLSLSMQFCRILIYFFASHAVNTVLPFKYFLIFTPIVMFVVMLPISLAGIGLRESSFVYFFSKVGVDPTVAFAISALVSVIIVVSILPGGLVLAFKGLALKKRSTTHKEEEHPENAFMV